MVFVGREREDHRPRCEKPGPGVIPTGGTEKNKCDAELFVACFVKNLNFSRHAWKRKRSGRARFWGGPRILALSRHKVRKTAAFFLKGYTVFTRKTLNKTLKFWRNPKAWKAHPKWHVISGVVRGLLRGVFSSWWCIQGCFALFWENSMTWTCEKRGPGDYQHAYRKKTIKTNTIE